MPRICAVYGRVSTDMQGDSLDNQVDYAREYIRRLGQDFQIAEECIYTDFDQSGYYTRFVERPAIQKAIDDAKRRRYEVIVFKEISRISRDQAEHVEIVSRFTQYGVRIIAINDNLDSDRPETLDLLGIHSVMSEMESKRISSRVSSGKKSLARRGQWIGEPPIGYKLHTDTKTLVPDPEFKDLISLMFRLFTEEGYGTFKIAEYLNAKKMYTKRGRLWSRSTVNHVLSNPAYVGDLVYGKTRNTLKRIFDETGYSKQQGRKAISADEWIIVPNTHAGLVDRDTFALAKNIMEGRAKQNPRRTRHPLTGILKCARCGCGMICQRRVYAGREYRYYCCSRAFKYGRAMCDQTNLKAESIERAALRFVCQLLRRFQGLSAIKQAKQDRERERDKMRKSLEWELQKTQGALERLFLETELSDAMFQKMKRTYVTKMKEVEQELALIDSTMQNSRETESWDFQVVDYVASLECLDLQDLDALRSVLQGLIHHMRVDGKTIKDMQLKYTLSHP